MDEVTTIDSARFQSGYTWEEYLDRIDRNREQFELHYDALELTAGEIEWIRGLERRTYVLAIGEPWCPDVFTNLPVVPKIASYNTGQDRRSSFGAR